MPQLRDEDIEERAQQLFGAEPTGAWASFEELPLLEQERYRQLAEQQLRMRR